MNICVRSETVHRCICICWFHTGISKKLFDQEKNKIRKLDIIAIIRKRNENACHGVHVHLCALFHILRTRAGSVYLLDGISKIHRRFKFFCT